MCLRLIVFFFFLIFSVKTLQGQEKKLFFTDEKTGDKVPFVHLKLNDSFDLYTDLDGTISVPFTPATILAKHPYYQEKYIDLTKDSLSISLTQSGESFIIQHSSIDAELIIKKSLAQKKLLRESSKRYYCKSYNKFSVSPEKRREINRYLNGILKFLSYDFDQFKTTHLFLMESISEIYQNDKVRKKERIIGIKNTGISLPSTYTGFIHPNPFALYENYINIANSKYISPLCHSSFYTYAYQISDTAIINNDTIVSLKFYPLAGKSLNAIRGIIYINTNSYAIQYFTGGPLYQGSVKIQASQEYRKLSGNWFPHTYKTEILLKNIGPEKVDLTLSGHSYIFDYKKLDDKPHSEYNEIILEYDTTAYSLPDSVWQKYRQDSLTAKDKATFAYFDSTGIQKRQESLLKLGERIYFGVIPIGMVNLDLNRIINTNYLEGLRLGMGFHTNKKFSQKWILGGYAGYGFKDKKLKYGTDISYSSELFRLPYTATVSYKNDIYEAGAQFFPFDLYQYSSEPLRKYWLSILNYVNQFANTISVRPVKYLNVNFGLALENHKTIYDYSYKENPGNTFNFTEVSTGFRYAFGEEFIQTPEDRFYLGTNFPIFWMNFTRGIKDFAGGEYNYSKLDLKVQQTFKFFRFGTTGIQIAGGITKGSPPYTKLYNMRGSFKDLSVVIHNSFETMRYNEFLSDRFIALFYSHDFGQLYTPDNDFRPNLVMVHNIGFGKLSNPEYHTKIPFKTMEKGFFESGVFLKNLIVLNFWGLKTGVGLGLFARYGPYAYRLAGDNVVFKLSTNFGF